MWGATTSSTRRRRLGLAIATATTSAGLVLGMTALLEAQSVADSSGLRLAADVSRLVDIDVGPADDDASVDECLTKEFAAAPSDVEVLYGVLQTSPSDDVPAMLLKNADGAYRMCDMFGGDSPATVPLRFATKKKPVQFLSNGYRSWECKKEKLTRFSMSQWLSVSSEVDSVRARFFVNGKPTPWFNTHANDGVAHLQAWLDGPVGKHASLSMKEKVLDAEGKAVKQSAIPTKRQKLTGCGHGPVVIG